MKRQKTWSNDDRQFARELGSWHKPPPAGGGPGRPHLPGTVTRVAGVTCHAEPSILSLRSLSKRQPAGLSGNGAS